MAMSDKDSVIQFQITPFKVRPVRLLYYLSLTMI